MRPAKGSDFESVHSIYMDASVNPYMVWEVMSLEEFRPTFNELLSGGGLHIYELQGLVVAVIQIDRGKDRRGHAAYIGGFGVQSSHQGQGLGRQIMKEVIQKLQEEGIYRIELIVGSDNPKAIQLYESLRFQKEGTLKKFFKRRNQSHFIDDYFMTLLMKPA